MRMPCCQENLSGNDLDEQSGENWVQARAQSGDEGDEQFSPGIRGELGNREVTEWS